MSKEDQARRTAVDIFFAGADITKDIKPYLLSVTYTDNEEDAADDLQIRIQDRDNVWLTSWLEEVIQAAAAAKLKISATIEPENWKNDAALPTGDFELDSVTPSGPPAEVTIKGTALPFSSPVRQTKKNKAWESYNLSGIANEIAGNAGMSCMYETSNDPFYKRVEQVKTSDIDYLSRLCHNAGISLKITDNSLVLFDQKDYESKGPVFTIKRGAGKYISYKLGAGAADTQYGSCRVSYTDPGSGKCIEGTFTASGEDAKSGQCLEITARVADEGEAKTLAEKSLRLHNKFTRTASFKLPGNTALVAGVTVILEGWGGWDGKLYVLMDDGTLATESLKREVLEACSADEVRPLTDLVLVEDAETVPYDIQFTYYISQQSTKSGAEIAAAVQAAVEKYIMWQYGKLGRDINPSKLYSLLMETGIKRVDLVSPVFTHLRDGNPVLGADMSYDGAEMVPQVAQVNSIQVMNGGYEDE